MSVLSGLPRIPAIFRYIKCRSCEARCNATFCKVYSIALEDRRQDRCHVAVSKTMPMEQAWQQMV